MKKEYDFSTGKRGPVSPVEPGKTRITIRIDNDILEYFRNKVDEQGGGNYQTMMNMILREHIHQDKPLKELIREVIREELKPAA